MIFLFIFTLLNEGDTLKKEINLEDKDGKTFYITDSLTKYPFTLIIYSVYQNAKLGKSIRLELEKEERKDLKIFEVAKLDFIPNISFFKKAVRAQFKIVKRDVLLDYEGILSKEIGFEEGKLCIFVFKNKKLKCKLFGNDKEILLFKVRECLNENR
ncbi:MAG: hypothetical protein ABIM98_07760 [candidate division WOR-3 bacterium]